MLIAPNGVSLRPYLATDAEGLAEIYRAAILQLAIEEYSEDQCLAWAQTLQNGEELATKLANLVTLVAIKSGKLAAFISLDHDGAIPFLYSAPAFARLGIANYLCAAIELLAQGRKVKTLKVEASDCAQPLFAIRGFVPMQRNSRFINGQWLANTLMEKTLEPVQAAMAANLPH